jgi:CRISPR-associated protein Csx14
MAKASIPVDLFNPGQVFACLGFLEATDVLLGEAEGTFDWSRPEGVRFMLRARGGANPVTTVLEFLTNAEVVAQAPHGSPNLRQWLKPWGAIEELAAGEAYPEPDPDSPATLRCVLRSGARELFLDHWGDATRRDAAKFWAGAGGYPGAALARDALELVRAHCSRISADPFAFSAPQSSSFRLDWRRDYIPIDAGFSLNKHANVQTLGFPIVELLGALGLGNARPERLNRLEYRYGVLGRASAGDGAWLPLPILRGGLGGGFSPFPTRCFRMSLGWPGKEGQARAITTVIEETTR